MHWNRKLVHVVAMVLVVGIVTLAAPASLAVAPVQDQEDQVSTEASSTSLVGSWVTQLWEKLLVWLPFPADPMTDPPAQSNSEGGDGNGDVGPAIDPGG